MRVISGKYRGKRLLGFNMDGTRPTMDRVKESLFACIQDKIFNSKCLDLFAGSGALGIEALSEGARSCDFVDNSIQAINIVKKNLENVDEKSEVFYTDYKRFLKNTDKKYDVIFLDPPYKSKLLNKALKFIEDYELLNGGGIVICEYEEEDPITDLKLIKEKNYGSKRIKIFEK